MEERSFDNVKLDEIGQLVHLRGTVWHNKETGETFVIPLSMDYDVDFDNAVLIRLDDLETLEFVNQAWLVEARRYYGSRGKAVRSALGRMQNQVEQVLIWRVYRRDNFQCVYCGDLRGPMTYDHYIPESQGGGTTFENGRTACKTCNKMKADMLPEEWLASKKIKTRKQFITRIQNKNEGSDISNTNSVL